VIDEEWLLQQAERFASTLADDPMLTVDAFVTLLGALDPRLRDALRRRLQAMVRVDAAVAALDAGASIRPGLRVAGFRVLGRIGNGGMGQVFEAYEERLDRVVALKFVHWAASANEALRLRREAEVIAALKHPNIVALHALAEHEGTPVLVLERIDGETLQTRVDAAAISLPGLPHDGRLLGRPELSWSDAVATVLVQVLDGLAAAHDRGVVHRDLKPANVLLDRSGRVRIVDFGLARMGGCTTLTSAGALVGTPSHLTPEYLRDRSNVGSWSDVYAAGVILYQLLTLTLPFGDDATPAVLGRIRMGVCTPAHRSRHGVPLTLSAIAERAMAPLGGRYPTAAEFSADLRRHLAHEPVHARPSRWPARLLRRLRGRPDLLAVAGVLLVSIVAAVTWGQSALAAEVRHRESLVTQSFARWAEQREAGRFGEVLAEIRRTDPNLVPPEFRRSWAMLSAEVAREARLQEGVTLALWEEDLRRALSGTGSGGAETGARSVWRSKQATRDILMQTFRDIGFDVPEGTTTPWSPLTSQRAHEVALVGLHKLLVTQLALAEQDSSIPVSVWYDLLDRLDQDPVRTAFRSLLRRGDLDGARAFATSPSHSELLTVAIEYLSEWLQGHGRGELAHRLAEDVRLLRPRDPRALALAATSATENWAGVAVGPDRAVVLERWLAVRAVAPDSAVVEYQVAVSLFRLDRVVESKDFAARAVDLAPGDPQLRLGLAQVLLRLRSFRDAIPHLLWLLANAPMAAAPGLIHDELGKAIAQSGGDLAEAYEHIAMAFSADAATFGRDMVQVTDDRCAQLEAAGRWPDAARAWQRIDGEPRFRNGQLLHVRAGIAALRAAAEDEDGHRDATIQQGLKWLVEDVQQLEAQLADEDAGTRDSALRRSRAWLAFVADAIASKALADLPVATVEHVTTMHQRLEQAVRASR
jgi:serine/threonine protein kinase/tetratricopeptide (TPR) repeat protein